jgi:hypothetical protein
MYDRVRSIPHSPSVAWDDAAFSTTEKRPAPWKLPVSQLNTQLLGSPVNASRQPSRAAAHRSGPERLARPHSAVDFHLLILCQLVRALSAPGYVLTSVALNNSTLILTANWIQGVGSNTNSE